MADKKEIKLIVKTEIDKAIKDFKKLEKQVDKAKDSKDRMRVRTEGLERTLGQLRNKILLVTFAFAGIGASISRTVQTSAQFEALETRLVALKGSVDEGRKSFDFFNKVAKTTPFQLANVVEAGAQLEAFGADSTETLKAVSDLAAFMGTDIVDAANAFGRAFAGGAGAADVLRERGVLTQVKLKTGFDDLSKLTLPQFREALIDTLTDPEGNISGATDLLSQT
jgi:phage tail tape-measure protein